MSAAEHSFFMLPEVTQKLDAVSKAEGMGPAELLIEGIQMEVGEIDSRHGEELLWYRAIAHDYVRNSGLDYRRRLREADYAAFITSISLLEEHDENLTQLAVLYENKPLDIAMTILRERAEGIRIPLGAIR